MQKLPVLIVVSIALVGCVSNTPVEQLTYTQKKALASKIEQRCIDQGYPPGNKEFWSCAKQESDREISTRKAFQANRGVVCFQSFNTVICN